VSVSAELAIGCRCMIEPVRRLKALNGRADFGLREPTPDLARIVTAWPSLPEPIRRAMLAVIG
jgi:hypothetical protein